MFNVLRGGEGRQPCSRSWEGMRDSVHVHCDGRG